MRACNYCDKQHPLTAEFWYTCRGKLRVCKVRRADYIKNNTEKIAKTKAQYKKTPKGKAVSKKSNQKNWASHMVQTSRRKDKKKKIYQKEGYITKEFLESQMDMQQSRCYYCDDPEPMLYGVGINRHTLRAATVERIDNDICHLQSNCVLIHSKCQKYNKSNTEMPEFVREKIDLFKSI